MPSKSLRAAKSGGQTAKAAKTTQGAIVVPTILPGLPLPHIPDEMELLQKAITSQDQIGKYLLAVAGITQQDLQEVVVQLRNALQATDTKFFSHEGNVVEQRDVKDWRARLAAIDKWLRLFKLTGGAEKKLPSGSDVLRVEVDLAPSLKRRPSA